MSSLCAGTIWRMLDGLAVSRALGDLHLRAGGLISSPEFSAWRALARQSDSFLVLVSDGITEVLSAKHLCQIAAATALGAALTLWAYTAFDSSGHTFKRNFSSWRALIRQSDRFLILISDAATEVLSAKHI